MGRVTNPVFWPKEGRWVYTDAWTARTWLKYDKRSQAILVRSYRDAISTYDACFVNRDPVGPLLQLLVRSQARSLDLLTVVFKADEWPEVHVLLKRYKQVIAAVAKSRCYRDYLGAWLTEPVVIEVTRKQH